MKRKSGELWISKSTPHTLKYYGSDTEYWVQSAITHTCVSAVKKGNVLVLDNINSSSGGVRPAVFPEDLNDIVGIAINDADVWGQVRVINYGYIQLERSELENLFVTKSDITVGSKLGDTTYYSSFGNMTSDGGAGNGWDTVSYDGTGAPIYWFSGRVLKTGVDTFSMIDGSTYPGKWSLATPSGYKYPNQEIDWHEDSLGVHYKGLPSIGNVVEYTMDGTDISSMIIHVNFTKFEKITRFEYPHIGLFSYDKVNDPMDIIIRHGLFSPGSSLLPYTNVEILGSSDTNIEGEIIKVQPGFSSIKNTSTTTVTIESDTNFYGKVIGDVSYSS